MMGTGNFADDFKRDAVTQITRRGYPAAEISKRLGASQQSLYGWKRNFSPSSSSSVEDHAAEIRQLEKELVRRCTVNEFGRRTD
jgi:transposase